MVSWLNGKASGIWSWAGRGWYAWYTLCQVEISSFIDSGVCDIYQHRWCHWSDHHNSSGSHHDFSYGVYPEELFWGLLVYSPYFYHLLHWFRDSRHWVRTSNLMPQPLALHNSLSQTVLLYLSQWNCPGSNRREPEWESSTQVCRIFRAVGWSWLPLQASPIWRAPCWGKKPADRDRLLSGAVIVIVIVVIITLIIVTIISSALCWVFWRIYFQGSYHQGTPISMTTG